MADTVAVAQRLYECLANADERGLSELLADDFVGVVSDGMPHGVGGVHRGPAAMITGVWARIAERYDIRVEPQQYLAVGDDRVVVLGCYRGAARDGTTAVDAAFAHVITARDGRMTALRQITDTARWSIPVS